MIVVGFRHNCGEVGAFSYMQGGWNASALFGVLTEVPFATSALAKPVDLFRLAKRADLS